MIPGVRRAMVAKQREIGERTSVVMEGRDIGTVVFPNAEVKIFLDANPRRARPAPLRRDARQGRDRSARGNSPRRCRSAISATAPARTRRWRRRPDAVYLDSTALGIEEVEEAILKIVRDARDQRKGISVEGSAGDEVRRHERGLSADRMRVSARAGRRGAEASGRWRSWSRRCSKITDLLLDTMRHAEAGDRAGIEKQSRRRCASATKRPAASCCRRREQAAVLAQIARRDRRIRAHRERHGDAGRAAAALGGRGRGGGRAALGAAGDASI